MLRFLRLARGRTFLSGLGAGVLRIAVRGVPRIAVRGLPLALAAGLALTAGACTTPAAQHSSAAGAAGEEAKPKKPWWRLSQYSRGPSKPMRPGDLPPGKPGLFSGKDGEIVLYRKGEGDSSDDSTKPTKVRR